MEFKHLPGVQKYCVAWSYAVSITITPTPIPSSFDDTQLKKALEVLDQEIAKGANGATEPAKTSQAAPPAEQQVGDGKKKTARSPVFPTTLKYVL